ARGPTSPAARGGAPRPKPPPGRPGAHAPLAGRVLGAHAPPGGGGAPAAAFGAFVPSYQVIHARQPRPARSWPASAARCNVPAGDVDFPPPGHPRDGAAYTGGRRR